MERRRVFSGARAGLRRSLNTLAAAELVFFGLLVAWNVVLNAAALNDDYWIRLASGRHVVQDLAIPRHDTFSFTALGEPWIDHEWLLGAGMYATASLNFEILVFVSALLAVLPFYLAYRSAAGSEGGHALLLALAVFAAFVAWRAYAIRPQLVNPVFFIVLLWLIDRWRRERAGPVWAAVPLVWAWANLQAGFMAGEAVLALWCAVAFLEQRDRTLATGLTAISLAAPLLNVYGVELYRYTLESSLADNADRSFVPEWQTPDFHDPLNYPHLAAIALIGFAGVRTRDPFRLLATIGTLVGSLVSARFVPFFAVALVWGVGPQLPRWQATAAARFGATALATTAGALLIFGVLATARSDEPLDDAPLASLAYLRASAGGERLYADQSWANYLAYNGWPVFFDTRTHQVYDDDHIRDYHRVERTQGDWMRVLDEWEITLVLHRRGSHLAEALDADPRWGRVFEAGIEIVWRRTLSSRAPNAY